MHLIAAVDENWGLGRNNGLLFHIPPDLKHFQQTTRGGVVIMGRKTLQSLPGGRPLPERVNLVLTRDIGAAMRMPSDRAIYCDSLPALAQALDTPCCSGRDTYVIGGAEIYRRLLPCCEDAIITHVYADGDADCFLPNLSVAPGWTCTHMGEQQEYEGLTFAIARYENASPRPLC